MEQAVSLSAGKAHLAGLVQALLASGLTVLPYDPAAMPCNVVGAREG